MASMLRGGEHIHLINNLEVRLPRWSTTFGFIAFTLVVTGLGIQGVEFVRHIVDYEPGIFDWTGMKVFSAAFPFAIVSTASLTVEVTEDIKSWWGKTPA